MGPQAIADAAAATREELEKEIVTIHDMLAAAEAEAAAQREAAAGTKL